jgi:hypothetical protein
MAKKHRNLIDQITTIENLQEAYQLVAEINAALKAPKHPDQRRQVR